MTQALLQLDLPAWLMHYGVVLLRITGLFVLVPIFGSQMLPLRIRLGMAAVLAMALMSIVPPLAIPPNVKSSSSWWTFLLSLGLRLL